MTPRPPFLELLSVASPMPLYETLVLIRARCAPAEVLNVVRRAANDLTRDGGVIRRLDNLGKRPLAYPMTKQKQKSRFAHLYRFWTDCSPSSLAQMDRAFRLDENVLRFMTTRLDPKKAVVDDVEVEVADRAPQFGGRNGQQMPPRSTEAAGPANNTRLAWLYSAKNDPAPVRFKAVHHTNPKP